MSKSRKRQSKKSFRERMGPAHFMHIGGFQDAALQRGLTPNIIVHEEVSEVDSELSDRASFHLKPGAKVLDAIHLIAKAPQDPPKTD